MGEWNGVFWTFFPFGMTGIRALLLCIPTGLLYLLLVAQWHIGQRVTLSAWETSTKYGLSRRTFGTLTMYALSAFFYCEVYIWTRAGAGRLQFTDPGRLHERTRLNERPIFLRFLFLTLAMCQGIMHLSYDYDRVPVSVKKLGQAQVDPKVRLMKEVMRLVPSAGIMAASALGVGSALYILGFRYWIYDIAHSSLKHIFGLGKSSRPTGLAPLITLVTMFLMQGACLTLLWNFSIHAFYVYMAQEPLKKDRPITADSKDPNGSLLTGLKSKKEDNKVCLLLS
jgi:nucleoporin NDC1